jgi:hypothetical protein
MRQKISVGDYVDYNPTTLKDIHAPVKNAMVLTFMPAGNFFKTDMAVIDGANGWVPCYDLRPNQSVKEEDNA